MVLILRTIEGSANAPFEEKLDPYKSALLQLAVDPNKHRGCLLSAAGAQESDDVYSFEPQPRLKWAANHCLPTRRHFIAHPAGRLGGETRGAVLSNRYGQQWRDLGVL